MTSGSPRWWPRTTLAAFYLFAGILHLIRPEPFLLIMPGWIPYPHAVVQLTGICEILGALGLLSGRLRRAAGWGLALYAVCVFPANIKHAIDGLPAGNLDLGWWYHAPRFALQPVIVWWALYSGGITGWPFQVRPER